MLRTGAGNRYGMGGVDVSQVDPHETRLIRGGEHRIDQPPVSEEYRLAAVRIARRHEGHGAIGAVKHGNAGLAARSRGCESDEFSISLP